MIIRDFLRSDADVCTRLFRDTVWTICSRDYSKKDLEAWVPLSQPASWLADHLLKDLAYVVEQNTEIIAFGSISRKGTVEMLYTHRDHQGEGAGSLLMTRLEEDARALGLREVSVESSRTARTFYEGIGYEHIKDVEKEHNGVLYINHLMVKKL